MRRVKERHLNDVELGLGFNVQGLEEKSEVQGLGFRVEETLAGEGSEKSWVVKAEIAAKAQCN